MQAPKKGAKDLDDDDKAFLAKKKVRSSGRSSQAVAALQCTAPLLPPWRRPSLAPTAVVAALIAGGGCRPEGRQGGVTQGKEEVN